MEIHSKLVDEVKAATTSLPLVPNNPCQLQTSAVAVINPLNLIGTLAEKVLMAASTLERTFTTRHKVQMTYWQWMAGKQTRINDRLQNDLVSTLQSEMTKHWNYTLEKILRPAVRAWGKDQATGTQSVLPFVQKLSELKTQLEGIDDKIRQAAGHSKFDFDPLDSQLQPEEDLSAPDLVDQQPTMLSTHVAAPATTDGCCATTPPYNPHEHGPDGDAVNSLSRSNNLEGILHNLSMQMEAQELPKATTNPPEDEHGNKQVVHGEVQLDEIDANWPANFKTGLRRAELVDTLEAAVMPLQQHGLVCDVSDRIEGAVDHAENCARSLHPNGCTDRQLQSLAAVVLYTMHWEPLQDSLYVKLNQILRNKHGRRGDTMQHWYKYIKLLVVGLKEHAKPTTAQILLRGQPIDPSAVQNVQEKFSENSKAYLWSFTSTSCDIHAPMKYAEDKDKPENQGLVYSFKSDTQFAHAFDIQELSAFPGEKEILILPCSKWKVTTAIDDDTGAKSLTLGLHEVNGRQWDWLCQYPALNA
eukprot:TRINITY_DN67716_c11_g2_i1.p1 TRINITY_DN67716_c11_g2~~TRINITY_DN67716_c11_g2_i1.p1  ORF type:complete len:564 (-),score=44.21 TRINITY_DN67716_c11_g2_i1:63-1646(-)